MIYDNCPYKYNGKWIRSYDWNIPSQQPSAVPALHGNNSYKWYKLIYFLSRSMKYLILCFYVPRPIGVIGIIILSTSDCNRAA